MLHRDIKPENVLLGSDGQVMMGDFGLAINLVRERPVSKVGTLDYMPPEVGLNLAALYLSHLVFGLLWGATTPCPTCFTLAAH